MDTSQLIATLNMLVERRAAKSIKIDSMRPDGSSVEASGKLVLTGVECSFELRAFVCTIGDTIDHPYWSADLWVYGEGVSEEFRQKYTISKYSARLGAPMEYNYLHSLKGVMTNFIEELRDLQAGGCGWNR